MPTLIDLPDKITAGLTESTKEVFIGVSKLDCIKDLFLCGGTGQSIQMNHRLSEDLDFELIGLRKERPQLDFKEILSELKVRSCFDLFEMFFEVKKSSFSSRFFSQIAPLSSLEEAVEPEVFHSQTFKQTNQNSFSTSQTRGKRYWEMTIFLYILTMARSSCHFTAQRIQSNQWALVFSFTI